MWESDWLIQISIQYSTLAFTWGCDMKKTSANLVKAVPLPVWARWQAQDADGRWWAYEHEPNEGDSGWYENEVGRVGLLKQDDPPDDWRKCLLRAIT